MSATIKNDLGVITYSDEVLKNLIGLTVTESYGVVGMVANGATEILKRDSMGKGVKIDVIDNKLIIDLFIAVKFGVSIKTVAENVIDNVNFAIKDNTELEIQSLNVNIQAIRV